MELQFNKSVCACLQKVTQQVQNQEQTQEVRLSDGMPDIGRVLGVWGQVLMRSKEWRSGGMNVSGGVMTWVLYAPEEGGEPRCVESWIPFSMKWDFMDPGRDGTIRVSCLLRGVDARSTSARKLMIRTGVSVMGEAYAPGETELYSPGELPEDIQLLRRTYPMRLPSEAGEKPFALEEELVLPASCPKLSKVIRYALRPEMIDQKVMAGKVVFRGAAILHILYCGEDGGLHSWNFEIPFSQFTELEKDHDQEASVSIVPAVTSMELETGEEGDLHLKAGLTGQYLVTDMQMIEVVEDAYSPLRSVVPQTEMLELPMILDEHRETVHAEQTAELEGSRVADVAFWPDSPVLMREPEGVRAELDGMFQMLYYDAEGNLQGTAPRWSDTWSLPAGQDSRVDVMVWPSGDPQASVGAGNAALRADLVLDAVTTARQGIPMVTGVTLGEQSEPDPNRPSLILRRAGEDSLWAVARSTGSTVDAIRQANGLQDEPDSDRMLLIPVS